MYYDAGTRLYYQHSNSTYQRFDPMTRQFQLHSYSPAYASAIAAYHESVRPKGVLCMQYVAAQ